MLRVRKAGQKELYYEVLRMIAICCVIFNHTGNDGFFLFSVTDQPISYIISMFAAIFCKVGVPIFFMISGALLIPKQEDLKTLCKKRILKIIFVIIFFSFILYIRQYIHHPEYGFGLFYFAKLIYSQAFVTPYWFLYSYLGLLIMLPFIRRMALNMSREEYIYLFILGLLFNCFIPIFDYFLEVQIYLKLFICGNVVFYPLLGYGMEHIMEDSQYSKKGCQCVLVLMLISTVFTGMMIYVEYIRDGVYTENYITLFVPVLTIGLFYCIRYWIKNRKNHNLILKRIVLCIGDCTFGIYLLEEILRTDLDGIFELLCPPIPSLIVCVIYILTVMVIGTIIVWIFKKITDFILYRIKIRWMKG